MTPNRSLIEKADLAIADLQSDGGYLNDQQADQFIRLAIKDQVLLPQISVTPMTGPREQRDKIRFGSRILRPATGGQALAQNQRAVPDLSKFTLDVKEFKAHVNLADDVLEDNIERGSFQNTVMALMSVAVGRDVEELAINGDTASGDAFLATMNGFLVQATANITNAASATLTKDVLKDMFKSMPDEFAKAGRLRYYTHRNARIDYRDSLANRATALGDESLAMADRAVYSDMPVIAVDTFPNSGSTQVLLTDPANLTVGFHRRIRVEMDRDVAAGVNLIVATVRFDVKIQEVTAAAKATNVSTT